LSAGARAALAGDLRDRVGFGLPQIGVIRLGDLAEVAKWDRKRLPSDVHRQPRAVPKRVVELELIGEVLDRIAIVVDVDLVDRVGSIV
jgi:hypothetical protein